MKTEIVARQDGSYEARVTFDAVFTAEMAQRLPAEIAGRAAEALTAAFIAQHGDKIIASVNLQEVLNLAVAKVVIRLSEEAPRR